MAFRYNKARFKSKTNNTTNFINEKSWFTLAFLSFLKPSVYKLLYFSIKLCIYNAKNTINTVHITLKKTTTEYWSNVKYCIAFK